MGLWCFQYSYTSVFPKLRQMSLSKNRFSSLYSMSEKMHQMKTLMSLHLSFSSIYLDGDCPWSTHLTELGSLGYNNQGNSVFKYLEDLSQFPKLTNLQLSSTSIQVVPAYLTTPSMLSPYADQNVITFISREVLAGLPKLQTLKSIHLFMWLLLVHHYSQQVFARGPALTGKWGHQLDLTSSTVWSLARRCCLFSPNICPEWMV